MNNYVIERIINRVVHEYEPNAKGYYLHQATSMMYNMVQHEHFTTYDEVEDFVRGLAHIFADGMSMGMIIQERKDKWLNK